MQVPHAPKYCINIDTVTKDALVRNLASSENTQNA